MPTAPVPISHRPVRGWLAKLSLLIALFLLSACTDPALMLQLEQIAAQQQAPIAQLEPGNRLLIQGFDGNIFSVAPDGSARFAYTDDASRRRQYLQPAWSPTAQRLAWTMVEQTDARIISRLVISDFDGGNRQMYETLFAPFYLYWSPDGGKLAYLSNWTSQNQQTIALRLVDLEDEDAAIRTLTQGQPLYFSWDPRGERLLTHLGNERIELQLPSGDRAPLGPTNAGFPTPQWLPNGEEIVYALTGDLRRELVIANLESQEIHHITSYSERIAFDLSPAGDQLAYVLSPQNASTAALGPLYVYNINTRSTHELTTAPVLAFFWSPDSQKLAYLAAEMIGERPHLRWHVWDGARSTGYAAIVPSPIFLQSYLPFFDQYTRSMTIWSPDSTAFAYAGIDQESRNGIWVQELDADSARRVAAGVFVAWSPR